MRIDCYTDAEYKLLPPVDKARYTKYKGKYPVRRPPPGYVDEKPPIKRLSIELPPRKNTRSASSFFKQNEPPNNDINKKTLRISSGEKPNEKRDGRKKLDIERDIEEEIANNKREESNIEIRIELETLTVTSHGNSQE